jgi:hypothetical protein
MIIQTQGGTMEIDYVTPGRKMIYDWPQELQEEKSIPVIGEATKGRIRGAAHAYAAKRGWRFRVRLSNDNVMYVIRIQ